MSEALILSQPRGSFFGAISYNADLRRRTTALWSRRWCCSRLPWSPCPSPLSSRSTMFYLSVSVRSESLQSVHCWQQNSSPPSAQKFALFKEQGNSCVGRLTSDVLNRNLVSFEKPCRGRMCRRRLSSRLFRSTKPAIHWDERVRACRSCASNRAGHKRGVCVMCTWAKRALNNGQAKHIVAKKRLPEVPSQIYHSA